MVGKGEGWGEKGGNARGAHVHLGALDEAAQLINVDGARRILVDGLKDLRGAVATLRHVLLGQADVATAVAYRAAQSIFWGIRRRNAGKLAPVIRAPNAQISI